MATEVWSLLKRWVSCNKIPLDKVKSQWEEGLHLITVPDGYNFYLAFALRTEAYPTVWGYVDKGGCLHCRHFYFSSSEAWWRAGTGFRWNYNAENPAGWSKSAEGAEHHIDGGYIFEAFLPASLAAELQKYYNGSAGKEIVRDVWFGDEWKTSLVDNPKDKAKKGTETDVKNKYESLLINKSRETDKRCDLVIDYDKERKYVYALDKKDTHVNADLKRKVLTTATATYQMGYRLNAGSHGMNYNYGKDKDKPVLAFFNPTDGLPQIWDYLTTCLTEKVKEETGLSHPTLGSMIKYSIITYKLDDYHVEIAYTESEIPVYYKFLGGRTISTPVCWVRNVYKHDSKVSSFGNYLECPIDMAFIVQKPCDYAKQLSEAAGDDIGLVTGQTGEIRRNRDLKKVTNFTVSNAKLSDIHVRNVFDKASDPTYVNLAFFNEKTSPLIQQFKKDKKFRMFSDVLDKNSFIVHDLKSEEQLVLISRLIVNGIDTYISISSLGTHGKGRHGSAGVNRAMAFRDRITGKSKEYSVTNLPHDFYELFVDNKVGGSRDGWSMFDSIRTNPSSLFTVVAQSILSAFVGAKAESKGSHPGHENVFTRLFGYACDKGVLCDDVLREVINNSDGLLSAVKRNH